MKFILLIAAVIGLSLATKQTRDLSSDLLELVDAIPIDAWSEISSRYREGDAAYQNVILYLQEADGGWAALVDRVSSNEQWQGLKSWLLERGVDIDARIQSIHDLIQSLTVGNGGDMGGLRSFADELLAVFSLDDLLITFNRLLSTSGDFAEFYDKISSEDARAFIEGFLFADEEVIRLADELRAAGIDVDYLKGLLYELLGWL